MKKILFILLLCSLSVNAQIVPFGFFEDATGCTDTVGDIFPTGNAASECSDESNAVGAWASQGSGAVASVAETSGGSDYVIEITSTDASASQGGQITITGITNGEDYDIVIRYRVTVDVSSTQAIRAWAGVVTSPDFTLNDDGNWHTETFSVTSNATQITTRIYSTRVAASGANKVQVDLVTCVQTS